MKINQEFKNLIPPLSAEEFSQLEKNILEEGIREDILTWRGFIIDGHNRYEIAQRYDLVFGTKEMEFEDEGKVKEWMILNQFGRRNLSNYQRSVLALALEGIFRDKARANLVASGEQYGKGSLMSENPITTPIDRYKEIAKVANVGHDTIAKVKKIQANASDEVKQKLSTGEVSINQAYQDIRKAEKIAVRAAMIDEQKQAIASGEIQLPSGVFEVIAIYPPWNYGREYDPESSRVANPYPEMTQAELLQLRPPFADDGVLFLWTTQAFIFDAKELLDAWGFTYKATITWDKERIGMGAWLRMQCEFCLVGIKGRPIWNNTKWRDIIREPRREHSRKPDIFYEMVEDITVGRRLEYFSREQRTGWETYGNDTEKF